MKKLLVLVTLMAFCVSITACAGNAGEKAEDTGKPETAATSEPTTEDVRYKVAYLSMSSEGDYWQNIENDYKEAVSTYGIDMEVINADYDPVRQVEQIENAILMDYDMLFVLPTDPDAVADACRKAMDAGIPVFAFIKDPGEENRTCLRGADEALIGTSLAEYAGDWAKENFGGENASCNVIVMGGTSAGSETERYEAVCAAVEADPQFNILEFLRVETSQVAAQTATENLLAKYDDVNLIIYCSVEMALGGVSYIESEASPIKDFSNFGIFGGGMSEEAAEDMKRAKEGTGVIRGCINTGGNNYQSGLEIGEQMLKIFNNEPFDAFAPVSAFRVSADNLAELGY